MKIMAFMTTYKFKKDDDERRNMIAEHVKNEYVPYEKKADYAQAIINNCYWETVDGVKKFHVNSIAKYMMTCMAIIDLYTDIERQKADGKMLEDFNWLNSSGALDLIIQKIDPKELKEFNMVLKMTEDDLMTNEYENHAFIRSQVERFGTLIGTTLAPFLDKFDTEELKTMIEQMKVSNGVNE